MTEKRKHKNSEGRSATGYRLTVYFGWLMAFLLMMGVLMVYSVSLGMGFAPSRSDLPGLPQGAYRTPTAVHLNYVYR